jgi:hypothetical protein
MGASGKVVNAQDRVILSQRNATFWRDAAHPGALFAPSIPQRAGRASRRGRRMLVSDAERRLRPAADVTMFSAVALPFPP